MKRIKRFYNPIIPVDLFRELCCCQLFSRVVVVVLGTIIICGRCPNTYTHTKKESTTPP